MKSPVRKYAIGGGLLPLLLLLSLLIALAGCVKPGIGRHLTRTRTMGLDFLKTLLTLQMHTDWVSQKSDAAIRKALEKGGYKLLDRVLHHPASGGTAYVATLGKKLVVAFRGTKGQSFSDTVMNALTDILAFLKRVKFVDFTKGRARAFAGKGLKVHMGFHNEYQRYQPVIRKLVRNHPDHEIYVTGHSLGGALATLCSFDLALTTGRKVQAFIFGSPRVGNEAFRLAMAQVVPDAIRIVHDLDPVPMVPPVFRKKLGSRYVHVGRLLQFNHQGRMVAPEVMLKRTKRKKVFKYHWRWVYGKMLRKLHAFCQKAAGRCAFRGRPDPLARAAAAERAAVK